MSVKKLTRVTHGDRTLYFTFAQRTGGGDKSATAFVQPEHVPAFEGDVAWFEVVTVKAKPWSYWRAVRQVEPPADA